MTGFEVRPEELAAAGRMLGTLAEDAHALTGTWTGATSDAAGAFPDSASAEAFNALQQDLAKSLGGHVRALGELATAVRDSSVDYDRTDAGAASTVGGSAS
ncbi:type VII secretion target [Saccharopolyspora sp. CA-218241]|uniref:type VII secretion target n=1 Tax=Saccharopolyspora sp. CA-218241 TaxID=3240027 RepID=UPI003D965F47